MLLFHKVKHTVDSDGFYLKKKKKKILPALRPWEPESDGCAGSFERMGFEKWACCILGVQIPLGWWCCWWFGGKRIDPLKSLSCELSVWPKHTLKPSHWRMSCRSILRKQSNTVWRDTFPVGIYCLNY